MSNPMSRTISSSVAGAIALAFSVGASAAIPPISSVAEAMLLVNDFKVRFGNNGVGVNDAGKIINPDLSPTNPGVVLLDISTTHNASTSLNGANGTCIANINGGGDAASACTLNVGLGTTIEFGSTLGVVGGSYAKTSGYSGFDGTSFSKAVSDSAGNALLASDDVTVHSTSVLANGSTLADGTSNQVLTTPFSLTFAVATDTTFEMSFNAEGFLRAALGQTAAPGNFATASYNWSAVVTRTGTGQVMTWSPDGTTGNLTCTAAGLGIGAVCDEFNDSFTMNDSIPASVFEDDTNVSHTSSDAGFPYLFEAELTVPAGNYVLTLTHKAITDTQVPVPLPGTLALLGLGLGGLGTVVRRRTTLRS